MRIAPVDTDGGRGGALVELMNLHTALWTQDAAAGNVSGAPSQGVTCSGAIPHPRWRPPALVRGPVAQARRGRSAAPTWRFSPDASLPVPGSHDAPSDARGLEAIPGNDGLEAQLRTSSPFRQRLVSPYPDAPARAPSTAAGAAGGTAFSDPDWKGRREKRARANCARRFGPSPYW